jgi:hypothetical protein
MRRRLLLVTLVGAAVVAAAVIWQTRSTRAQPQPPGPEARPAVLDKPARPPAPPLPITQVILFNSGVGYFQREGEIEESTRVDLSFQATDINDLLKSLVLQDLGGGQISSISYDSHDPIEKTLKSFSLDLTTNPTFGQILNQARGEKIEVTLQGTSPQPATLTGTIVGMESQPQPAGKEVVEAHLLNVLCAEGMRSVPLSQVQRVRFLNPVLESEFRRALEVLASAHDTQKKTVSVSFSGKGKRPVRVGYVVENPIWKTSYRLVLDASGKCLLQGWAVVENTSDDDWNNVRMILVSGRPISYQMNLYQPLYIPRPTVEPELFASLRPPTYDGSIIGPGGAADMPVPPGQGAVNLGALGAVGGGNVQLGGLGLQGQANLGAGGGMFGQPGGYFNRYQLGGQLGNLGVGGLQLGNLGGNGLQLGGLGGQLGNASNPMNRLTYEQLQQRRQEQLAAREKARQVGSRLSAIDPHEGITSVAAAEEIGDYFQYVIEQRVSLPRQKSALFPILSKQVETTKVSIFNEAVHAKFPLLGLKFKNTCGQHLMQGPVTVYEDGSYAGDARIMDLQPNEERLLSYAIDLGTEVKVEDKNAQNLTAVKIVKGVVRATTKVRRSRTYVIKNRSEHERLLLLEHPVHDDWKLVSPAKPSERSREFYRFQVSVPAGTVSKQEVVEEQPRVDQIALLGSDEPTTRFFLKSSISSPKVKEAIEKAVGFRTQLAETQGELTRLTGELKNLTDDQARLRANLREVPATSAAHKRYLEKFDTQETEIEKFQTQFKQMRATEAQQKKVLEGYLANLNVE